MKRRRQTLEEIVSALSEVPTSWRDAHADAVIRLIEELPQRERYGERDLRLVLDRDFKAGLTLIRLSLELSKDEFNQRLSNAAGAYAVNRTAYLRDAKPLLAALSRLGVGAALTRLASTPVSWRTVLVERLKAGRGSAIKGQSRGRALEDATEKIVQRVFGNAYHSRCRFRGATGTSTEKADFAIPTKSDPQILVEAKAYGATGSKQTDILGDFIRIIREKRNDTDLLFVTDGISWKARLSDLRKLIEMQNQGGITRIYTGSMQAQLEADLKDLKLEHGL